jgi:hypothetical protein
MYYKIIQDDFSVTPTFVLLKGWRFDDRFGSFFINGWLTLGQNVAKDLDVFDNSTKTLLNVKNLHQNMHN